MSVKATQRKPQIERVVATYSIVQSSSSRRNHRNGTDTSKPTVDICAVRRGGCASMLCRKVQPIVRGTPSRPIKANKGSFAFSVFAATVSTVLLRKDLTNL